MEWNEAIIAELEGSGRRGIRPRRSAAAWASPRMPWSERRTGSIFRRAPRRSAGRNGRPERPRHLAQSGRRSRHSPPAPCRRRSRAPCPRLPRRRPPSHLAVSQPSRCRQPGFPLAAGRSASRASPVSTSVTPPPCTVSPTALSMRSSPTSKSAIGERTPPNFAPARPDGRRSVTLRPK